MPGIYCWKKFNNWRQFIIDPSDWLQERRVNQSGSKNSCEDEPRAVDLSIERDRRHKLEFLSVRLVCISYVATRDNLRYNLLLYDLLCKDVFLKINAQPLPLLSINVIYMFTFILRFISRIRDKCWIINILCVYLFHEYLLDFIYTFIHCVCIHCSYICRFESRESSDIALWHFIFSRVMWTRKIV